MMKKCQILKKKRHPFVPFVPLKRNGDKKNMDKTLVNKNDKKKSLDRGKTDTQITIHLFITFFFVVSFYDKKNALKTWMICILTGYEIFSTTLTFFLSE